MDPDLAEPAEVLWHSDEEEPPAHWSGATPFSTLAAAVEAIVGAAPQTGHPWIRCGERILAPAEIEALWQDLESG